MAFTITSTCVAHKAILSVENIKRLSPKWTYYLTITPSDCDHTLLLPILESKQYSDICDYTDILTIVNHNGNADPLRWFKMKIPKIYSNLYYSYYAS